MSFAFAMGLGVNPAFGMWHVARPSLFAASAILLASCASKPLIVAPAVPAVAPDFRSVETVLLLEPQRRIVDLRGRDTAQAYAAARLTQDMLLTTAGEILRARQPTVRAVLPDAAEWSAEHAERLRTWSDRSLQVTRGGRVDPVEIGALLDDLGLVGDAAVLFSSLEARLGDDGYDAIPLVWTGQAQTHMSVLRSALFARGATTPAWTNSILLRASPAVDSPELRQAVRQLFIPLQR